MRWLATIALPSSSRRRLAADAVWPACGRSAIKSAANARSVPSNASMDIAAVTSAVRSSTSRSARASTSMPSIPSVPLIRASPSLACNVIGATPAAAAAGAHSPSPIRARATWASGARSPLAPSDPCSGTVGVIPALSSSTMRSTTTGRTPEYPSASERARSSIIARTTSSSTAGPIPAACERISERCSSSRRSAGITVVASDPNPVETP